MTDRRCSRQRQHLAATNSESSYSGSADESSYSGSSDESSKESTRIIPDPPMSWYPPGSLPSTSSSTGSTHDTTAATAVGLVLCVCCCVFMYIIRSDAGQPLREELAKSPEKIVACAFPEFLPKSDTSMAQGSLTPPAALVGEEGCVVSPLPVSSNSTLQPLVQHQMDIFRDLLLLKL
ncbi:hypothetical protein LOK49_LG12G02561 [Camellia lanceoleosa]|uniref:Uncharacterized protein n=1 Tax=Camellia lanceoleosa TaxID=1840588 RepID=A0ACC0FX81_9ERIC|nr:hypothetical protein LOK49_LG12G02561 [Camellia lanceoleosa]